MITVLFVISSWAVGVAPPAMINELRLLAPAEEFAVAPR